MTFLMAINAAIIRTTQRAKELVDRSPESLKQLTENAIELRSMMLGRGVDQGLDLPTEDAISSRPKTLMYRGTLYLLYRYASSAKEQGGTFVATAEVLTEANCADWGLSLNNTLVHEDRFINQYMNELYLDAYSRERHAKTDS
jgi:hypothetical protein